MDQPDHVTIFIAKYIFMYSLNFNQILIDASVIVNQ